MSTENIVKINQLQYIHVLDMNTNIPSMYKGPRTYVLKDNEQLTSGPSDFVIIPPGKYCTIENPVVKETALEGILCSLRFGRAEARTHEDSPFPLYVGEKITVEITDLPVVREHQAIRLTATLPFTDENSVKRNAGDIWQLQGPLVYVPREEVEVLDIVNATVININESLKLEAQRTFLDTSVTPNVQRVVGEKWLYSVPGQFIPNAASTIIERVRGFVLTPEEALHFKALKSFTDMFGKQRKSGDEWLVTVDDVEMYTPGVWEDLVGIVKRTVLTKSQYCVIKNQKGELVLRQGVCSFFLNPYENMVRPVRSAALLTKNESLVVRAEKDMVVGNKTIKTGERWLVQGPTMFIPPIEVKVLSRRTAINLRLNEGVYVRDLQTGSVRAVMGPISYVLGEWEELWEKHLSTLIVQCLKNGGGYAKSGDIRKLAYFSASADPTMDESRNKSKVVTYRPPNNTAVQVLNHSTGTSRIVFGPNLVTLGPEETFNVLSLSAGKPKVSNALYSICLLLGPDYISDIIEVETSDHARLYITLSCNNHFEYDANDVDSLEKLFSIKDFIGFVSRNLASRIRSAVAGESFENFHKHSARIVKNSIFNKKDVVRFPNGLVITNVDVQCIEPVDNKMKESLVNAVQMAIEVSTKSMEQAARREADIREQKAIDSISLQKLQDDIAIHEHKIDFTKLSAENSSISTMGSTLAEAQSKVEEILIEAQSEKDVIGYEIEAKDLEFQSKIYIEEVNMKSERDYKKAMNDLEIHFKRETANIEISQFKDQIDAIGAETIAEIACAGPEMQAKLLGGLGLESVLLTDGSVNLFNTANGLVGA